MAVPTLSFIDLEVRRLQHAASTDGQDWVNTRWHAIGGGVFIALVLFGVGVATWNMRAGTLAEARRTIQQLGVALSEQTGRSIQGVDLVLQDTERRLLLTVGNDPLGFREKAGQPDVEEMLQQHLRTVPQAEALSIVDSMGDVVNFTRRYPPPPINVADRDYFIALKTGADGGTFISAPVQNRGNNNWTVYLARRLTSGQGGFLGVVLAAMPLSHIEEFYRTVTTKPGSQVSLYREDGLLLAQFPHDGRLIARTRPEGQPPLRDSGGLLRTTGQDGVVRLVSTHMLTDRPLVLEVSVTEDAALAGWRRQAIAIAVSALLAAACMVVMLRTITRQFAEQQAGRLSLALRNAELEETRARLESQTRELEAAAEALRGNERLLAERSATLKTTLENIDQGLLMIDGQGIVVAYNQHAIDLLDLPADLLARRPSFRDLLQVQWDNGEFADLAPDLLAFLRAGGLQPTRQTYERQRPNGRMIEVNSMPVPGGGIVRTYSDVTERRIAEARIRFTAHYDELTGLANRVSVQQALGEAIAACDGEKGVALLYLDLDRFRLINDARGYDVGDALLIEVARRLKSLVRSKDLVARMAGDEFAIVQTMVSQPEEASRLAERLRERMAEPFIVSGLRLTLGVSVGVAVVPDSGTSAETVRRSADIAMYRAKDSGGNAWCMYEPAMAAQQQEQFLLEQALREALGSRSFVLAYQPIVSLESNAVVGYEALLRWTHPVRGDVPPQEFVPVAEATGLIEPIGRWVLETACREAASWNNQCRIAVNLSPVQFRHGNLLRSVREALAQSGLAPGRLELEVTEGLLLEDTGAVHEAMTALREAGVGITLDDFGTGHAGLSYLRRFPFDKIKIDRSFVRNLGHDPQSDAIVEAILLLCRRLNLNVVAEGVEEQEQLEQLRRLRCPLVQGYLTGRPMPAAQARAL